MSSVVEQLQKFLKQKLDELKLKRKDFIEGSGVSLTTTSQILNADLRNPDFNTILKTANYFNCSLDEVIGRDKSLFPKANNYQDLSQDQINQNLKSFINKKLQETGLNQYQLGKKLGFNHSIIYNFMQEHKAPTKLSSAVIIALAEHFNVSLDEMIGRTTPALQKAKTVEKDHNLPSAVQKLSAKDKEALQQIKQSLSTQNQTVPSNNKPSPHRQEKNSKDMTR